MLTDEKTVAVQVSVTALLIDAKTMGKMLGVSRKTIYNMLADGRLGPQPVRKFGRRTLWSRVEVEEWVQSDCPSKEEWAQRRTSGKVEKNLS
jgi:excisionase family DNA binding protein